MNPKLAAIHKHREASKIGDAVDTDKTTSTSSSSTATTTTTTKVTTSMTTTTTTTKVEVKLEEAVTEVVDLSEKLSEDPRKVRHILSKPGFSKIFFSEKKRKFLFSSAKERII